MVSEPIHLVNFIWQEPFFMPDMVKSESYLTVTQGSRERNPLLGLND